jgi:hypothetical protein
MKCFIAVDEDLLLKLWMLDPQLVAPFSQTDIPKNNGVQRANHRSQYQLRECHLAIEEDTQAQGSTPGKTAFYPK